MNCDPTAVIFLAPTRNPHFLDVVLREEAAQKSYFLGLVSTVELAAPNSHFLDLVSVVILVVGKCGGVGAQNILRPTHS